MIRQVQEIVNAPEGSEQRGYFIVTDIAFRKTRVGHDYATMLLKDASGNLPAKMWREKLPLLDKYAVQNNMRVMADLKVTRFRGRAEGEIRFIRPIREEDAEQGYREELLERWAKRSVDEMYSELLSLIDTVEKNPIKELLLKTLEKYGKAFKVMPGARSIHHAYQGGLLEHTLAVARICLYLGDLYNGVYPQGIDRDILLAGAILHDMGKIEEIDRETLSAHTAYGSLIGHILISRDIVREQAAEIEDLDPGELLLLEHLVVSHQGRKEWGAPQEPKTPEALILHYADDCDAKVNIFFNALEMDRSEGVLTDRHEILGRQLYKKSAPSKDQTDEGRQMKLDL